MLIVEELRTSLGGCLGGCLEGGGYEPIHWNLARLHETCSWLLSWKLCLCGLQITVFFLATIIRSLAGPLGYDIKLHASTYIGYTFFIFAAISPSLPRSAPLPRKIPVGRLAAEWGLFTPNLTSDAFDAGVANLRGGDCLLVNCNGQADSQLNERNASCRTQERLRRLCVVTLLQQACHLVDSLWHSFPCIELS